MKETFLVTTALEEFWDTTKEIVFLGEWCKLYNRKSFWKNLNTQMMPYPWDDEQKLRKAIFYVTDLYEKLLPKFAAWFNEIHNVDYPVRYWRIYFGSFLFFYIQVFYDRYICLKKAFQLYPNLKTHGLAIYDQITPSDTIEFMNNVGEDYWNLQFYSQICQVLGINVQNVKPINILRKLDNKAINANSLLSRIKAKFKCFIIVTFIKYFCKKKVLLYLVPFRRRFQLKLILKTRLRALPINISCHFNDSFSTINMNIREKLTRIAINSEFENVLLHSLMVNLPKQYIETYKTTLNRIKPLVKRVPNAVFTSIGYYYNKIFSAWIAECNLIGTKLIGVQHGGSYGELQYNMGEILDRATTDYFISWGWKGKNVFSMPAIKFINVKKKDRKRKGILWVTTSESRYSSWLSFYLMGPQILDYINYGKLFILSLKDEIRSNVKLRLHKNDCGWYFDQRYKSIFPKLQIEKANINFMDRIQEVELVVVDYLGGTPFLEALVLNIPVLMFGNPRYYPVRASFKNLYDKLKKVGLIYHSGAEAAYAVNEFYYNLDDWWNDKDRQNVINDYKNNYTLTTKDALSEWSNLLIKTAIE